MCPQSRQRMAGRWSSQQHQTPGRPDYGTKESDQAGKSQKEYGTASAYPASPKEHDAFAHRSSTRAKVGGEAGPRIEGDTHLYCCAVAQAPKHTCPEHAADEHREYGHGKR